MKKVIYITLFLILLAKTVNAQNPTILDRHTSLVGEIPNAYYKDIEGFYNQFEGTWVYTDSEKTIRFRFKKKEEFFYQSVVNYYIDVLIGEMQFISNNQELINSLSNIDVNHNSIFRYSLFSRRKVGYNYDPMCLECPTNVQRLPMMYDEPTNDDSCLAAYFVMRIEIENGLPKLKVQYNQTVKSCNMNKNNFDLPSTTTNFTIPYGNYTFTKEN